MNRSLRAALAALVMGSALAVASTTLEAQSVRPRGGGGNAESSPMVFKTWAEAESACLGAQNKWRVARDAYNNARRKYDDLQDSGGGSTDKAGQIAEARREKDDKSRTEVSFRNAYKRAATGCVNFAADEMKAATTDAQKQTAKEHQATAARWDGEAKGG